jgi:hypothetical protein
MSREPLLELKARGIVRTLNAPAGDYAEWLVAQTVGGALTPNSTKSYDVLVEPSGERIQVKCRVVVHPHRRSERQLSPFRSWDFDSVVVVLFDEAFGVRRMTKLPRDVVQAAARTQAHVNGDVVFATDVLLDHVRAVELRPTRGASSIREAPPRDGVRRRRVARADGNDRSTNSAN